MSRRVGPWLAGAYSITDDFMLMTKCRLCADDPLIPTGQVSLMLGLSLPTGSTHKKNGRHPLAVRKEERLPYSMQLGSGTWDPSVGLLYQLRELAKRYRERGFTVLSLAADRGNLSGVTAARAAEALLSGG